MLINTEEMNENILRAFGPWPTNQLIALDPARHRIDHSIPLQMRYNYQTTGCVNRQKATIVATRVPRDQGVYCPRIRHCVGYENASRSQRIVRDGEIKPFVSKNNIAFDI